MNMTKEKWIFLGLGFIVATVMFCVIGAVVKGKCGCDDSILDKSTLEA